MEHFKNSIALEYIVKLILEIFICLKIPDRQDLILGRYTA